MNRIEVTSRLLAVENGDPESDWEKYRERAIKGLKQIPLTDAELEVEVSEGWYKLGLELLKSSVGRHKILHIANRVRTDLNKRS